MVGCAPHRPPCCCPTSVSFIEALRFWLKLGFISEKRILHALNYCMVMG